MQIHFSRDIFAAFVSLHLRGPILVLRGQTCLLRCEEDKNNRFSMGPVIVIKYSLILTEVIDFSYAQNFLYHVVKCEIREAK